MEWTQTGCEFLWAGHKVHQVVPEEPGASVPPGREGAQSGEAGDGGGAEGRKAQGPRPVGLSLPVLFLSHFLCQFPFTLTLYTKG